MQGSARTRMIAALLLAAVTFGCASQGKRAPSRMTTCYPGQCFLDVQNYGSVIIGVRYHDSTGVGDVLGSVKSGSIRRFVLPRRTSRTITLEVSLRDQMFRAQSRLSLPPLENVFHFPADFQTTITR